MGLDVTHTPMGAGHFASAFHSRLDDLPADTGNQLLKLRYLN